ncbi:hypothetical protein JW998_03020 [candidate division KSB1 bacterium]|nr:hypothetical protein [candidate division KSB1 bacterium]
MSHLNYPPRMDILGDLVEGCVLFYQVLEAFATCNDVLLPRAPLFPFRPIHMRAGAEQHLRYFARLQTNGFNRLIKLLLMNKENE